MRLVILFLAILTTCESANAGFLLSWTPTSSTSTVLGGAAISANLVLTETVTTNINDFGVAGGSFTVTRAGAGTLSLPVGNAAFDSSTAGGTDPMRTLDQTSILGVGLGSNSVILGSFSITPTSIGTGTLTVSAFGSPADIAVYTNNAGGSNTLSPGIFTTAPTFAYTVTAVPEPASILLVGLAGLGGLTARRFRMKLASGTNLIPL